jgi:hypothetical protein
MPPSHMRMGRTDAPHTRNGGRTVDDQEHRSLGKARHNDQARLLPPQQVDGSGHSCHLLLGGGEAQRFPTQHLAEDAFDH